MFLLSVFSVPETFCLMNALYYPVNEQVYIFRYTTRNNKVPAKALSSVKISRNWPKIPSGLISQDLVLSR